MVSDKCYKYVLLAFLAILVLSPTKTQAADVSLIQRKQWERLKDGHDYSEKIPKQKPKKKMELKKPKERQSFSFNMDGLLRGLSYAAIFLLLLVAVYFIIRKMGLFDKVNFKKDHVDFEERTLSLPLESQLKQLMNKALLEKDFRLAVHILYALMLIKMHHQKLLVFSEEKTPGEYLKEVSDSEVKKNFGHLVLMYEQTWFGNYPFSKNSWDSCFLLYQHSTEK